MKYKYQKWLLPEGIEFDPKNELQARELCFTYQLLEALKTNNSGMVEELGTKLNLILPNIQDFLIILKGV